MGVTILFCLFLAGGLPGGIVMGQENRATYGFELMRDHDGRIIIYSIDSLSDGYQKGIRPGMQVIGWNTVPIERKLKTIPVRKLRKQFPGLTDDQIRLNFLAHPPGAESAEIFFMTETENNWGVRVKTADSRRRTAVGGLPSEG